MRLHEWLKINKHTHESFGKIIKATPQAVGNYKLGHRIPKKAIMILIFNATSGQVQPNDFYSLPNINIAKSRPVINSSCPDLLSNQTDMFGLSLQANGVAA